MNLFDVMRYLDGKVRTASYRSHCRSHNERLTWQGLGAVVAVMLFALLSAAALFFLAYIWITSEQPH